MPVTFRILPERGIVYIRYEGEARLEGGGRLLARDIEVPADFSSAAFFLVAAGTAQDPPATPTATVSPQSPETQTSEAQTSGLAASDAPSPFHPEHTAHLPWRERVYRHRDYFDAGALLYEHLPLLGSVIAWLKRRLA